jgi:cytochrome c553
MSNRFLVFFLVALALPNGASAQGDSVKGQAIATTVCAACHGPDGNSPIPANPRIAGQPAAYIAKQLADFQASGGKDAARASAFMSPIVANLSKEDMLNLGAFFSQQKAGISGTTDRRLAETVQKLYRGGDTARGIPACSSCHGPTGAGIAAQFPRIGGQHASYIETQLLAFRSEARKNDPAGMMRSIATKLRDQEIKALGQFAAGLH